MDAVERFTKLSREYCDWVLVGTDRGPDAARRALLFVSQLYAAALELPPQWCSKYRRVKPLANPTAHDVYASLTVRLPFQHYGEVFNPLPVPPEEAILGDLADDLADVFAEVESGLRWIEAGYPAEAVWEWGFGLAHHWGEHATSAIRALQCWLASEHPELLTDQKHTILETTEANRMTSHPELEFFNSLSGKLHIELDVPPERIGDLLNVRALPDAQIARLELRAEVYNRDTEEFRPLTPEEWESVAFRGDSIKLRSEDGEVVSHAAPNGSYFTVRELLRAVEETERQTRSQSEWFGGIDVHHVYFEGIHLDEDDVWEIYWGS